MNNLTMGQIRVLSALDTDEMYGYEIIKYINKSSGLRMVLGSLYNTLKSLERKKLVESYWSNEESAGGRRKYFRITGLGRKIFNETTDELLTNFGAVRINTV
jgi:PadR family transcriptional regulator